MGEKGYKAFNSDFTCKGKQYEENTTYEESGDRICDKGVMHYCENPLDVLNYYPLVDSKGRISEFAEVEALGKVYHEGDKSATNKLYIGAKLGLKGFIKACIDFINEKTKITDNAQIGSSGNYANIGSSGYNAQIGSSGYYAKINSTGENTVIAAIGSNSMAKAKKGSWITLAEYDDEFKPVCVKTEYVDGERIKEDMFYCLVDGNFKEVEE
jgi:hypothetical protein